ISYDNYQQRCKLNKIVRLRTGRPGFKALVKFEVLPEEWQKTIRETYGDPAQVVKHESFLEFLIKDTAAIIYYRDYRYGERRTALTKEKQQEYCMNADLLNCVQLLVNNRKARCK